MIKVTAAHVAPVFMNPMASAEKAVELIADASAAGSSLIVFPEVFLPGFPYWINCYAPLLQGELNTRYQDLSVEADGPELGMVREAAAAHEIIVVMGASERERGGRTCYNTSFTIDADGTLLAAHRKLQPTYAERYIWGQGDGSTLDVVDTVAGRIGALACWEHTMNLARQALIDQQMQIHAALWPSLSTMAGFADMANVQIEAMMKNHALTGQCFVVCASSPVTQTMLDYLATHLGEQALLASGGGWTAVIHPFGLPLAGPVTGEVEHLVHAEIELEDINSVKLWVDTTGHYSRPEVLSLNHNREAFSPYVAHE